MINLIVLKHSSSKMTDLMFVENSIPTIYTEVYKGWTEIISSVP